MTKRTRAKRREGQGAAWALSLALVWATAACDGKADQAPTPTPITPVSDAAPLPRVQVNVAPGCEAGAGARVCFAGNVTACRADGSLGAEVEQCPDGCAHGRCTQTCEAQGVELVYVIDKVNTLHAFDPRALPGEEFRRIGTLTCAAGDSPFSMTVDRRGVGWVLYNSGRLFRVSVVTGACLREVTLDESVPTLFGQAFVRDVSAAPPLEVLMISVNDDRPSSRLGALDLSRRPASWRAIGPLPAGWIYTPDLTTTADGRLFAYVPPAVSTPGDAGLVQELSPRTGKPVSRAMKIATGGEAGSARAWALAHWGGTFYVFLTLDEDTRVYAVDRKTRASRLVRSGLPVPILGAGVSTCAPLLERAP
ncbi:MAG: hypothetical protein KA297_27210 [Kofleriaceae bacterium]|nr:hypothetical protein [Kofleriaceae bacterium]MBP6836896.1 hypothetical protein [Kofleriaceae bacterium]